MQYLCIGTSREERKFMPNIQTSKFLSLIYKKTPEGTFFRKYDLKVRILEMQRKRIIFLKNSGANLFAVRKPNLLKKNLQKVH